MPWKLIDFLLTFWWEEAFQESPLASRVNTREAKQGQKAAELRGGKRRTVPTPCPENLGLDASRGKRPPITGSIKMLHSELQGFMK